MFRPANHEYEMSLGTSSYVDCFKGNLGKRLLTGCLLQALQQCKSLPVQHLHTHALLIFQSFHPVTGVNFIFYYGTSFFANSGIQNPFIVSIITSIVNILSTIPGLYAVDKFGRRSVLLAGAIGMAVCQVSLDTNYTSSCSIQRLIHPKQFIVAAIGTAAGIDNLPAQKALIAIVCVYIVSPPALLPLLPSPPPLHHANPSLPPSSSSPPPGVPAPGS